MKEDTAHLYILHPTPTFLSPIQSLPNELLLKIVILVFDASALDAQRAMHALTATCRSL